MALTQIKKWGNSYGVRIPKDIMEEMELGPDTRVDIRREEGKIILTPVSGLKLTLKDLLDQITPENLHEEMDPGNAVGNEKW